MSMTPADNKPVRAVARRLCIPAMILLAACLGGCRAAGAVNAGRASQAPDLAGLVAKPFDSPVSLLRFTSDSTLLCADANGDLSLWWPLTAEFTSVYDTGIEYPNARGRYGRLIMPRGMPYATSNGRHIASITKDNIQLLHSNGDNKWTLGNAVAAECPDLRDAYVALDECGRRLAVVCQDSASIYSTSNPIPEQVLRFKAPPNAIGYSADGRTMGIADLHLCECRIVDVEEEVTKYTIPKLLVPCFVAFSPRGRFVAVGYMGVFIHATDSEPSVALLDTESGDVSTMHNKTSVVLSIDFSNDDALMACGDYHGTVSLWDPSSKTLLREWFNISEEPVCSIALSPNKAYIAYGDYGGSIKILSIEETDEPTKDEVQRQTDAD